MPTKPQSLFILAGEPSGDQLGANMLAQLRKKAGAPLDIFGVGGEKMQAEGLQSLYPISDLAVMGVTDVLRAAPRLLWRARQTVKHIIAKRPDFVILIDSQLFSYQVAKALKKKNYAGKIFLYVAPAVWVHGAHRAKKYNAAFDEIWAILPFEPKVLHDLGGPKTRFVGHPVIPGSQFEGAPPQVENVLIYPGSRQGELRRHMTMFQTIAEQLHAKFPHLKFALPTLQKLQAQIESETISWNVPIEVSADPAWRKDLLSPKSVALCAAGTATLELAAAKVPTVMSYVMDTAQARKFAQMQDAFIALPNIILDTQIIPEFMQANADVKPPLHAMTELISDQNLRAQQISKFHEMEHVFSTSLSEGHMSAADVLWQHMQSDQRH